VLVNIFCLHKDIDCWSVPSIRLQFSVDSFTWVCDEIQLKKMLSCCRTLFCSSVLNLAELVALRPDLQPLKKIIYFHENQLIYPVRKQQARDFQFGYNQILSG